MPLILLLIIVGVPIVELMLLIEVGNHIGALYTVGLVIVTAAVGVTLVRMQGYAAIARAQASLDENKLPVGEAVHGVFLLLAGGLLLFPGFITDAIGLLLLIPIVRMGIGLAIWRALAARGMVRWGVGGGDDVIDGEFEDVTNRPEDRNGRSGRDDRNDRPARLDKPTDESDKADKRGKPRRKGTKPEDEGE